MLNLDLIEGIPYVNPPKPPNREIRNYGLPVKKQKWSRHTEYEEYDWSEGWQDRITLPENEDQLKYIEEELVRLYDGEWIYIKGEPIYLNNYAYFFLQWMLLENEYYPQFRDANLYYFRFIELVEKDRMCWGHALIKGRRLGASSMEASIMLLQGLISRNTRQGIISKTGADAQDIFDFVVIAFQALPAFLKPDIEGTDAPKKELSIKKQASKITKDKSQASSREGLNNKILWKATALNSFDSGKLKRVLADECLAVGTKIMSGDGTFKPIEDFKVGDLVTVEGGKVLPIGKVFRGFDDMYRIVQPYGKDYIVNSAHRLYLERRDGRGGGKYETITPLEYLSKTDYQKRTTYAVKSGGIDFHEKEVPIDPYILGAWIGDGYSNDFSFIINPVSDPEILDAILDYCKKEGYEYNIKKHSNSNKVVIVKVISGQGIKRGDPQNKLDILRELGVFKNKHIPSLYLHNSREVRLQLLAGIIDTDGHNELNSVTGLPKGSYKIVMSNYELISQIKYLSMSLGLSTSEVKESVSNFNTKTYGVTISGDINKIPVKVSRKSMTDYTPSYKSRRIKMDVQYVGRGEYVGVQVITDCDLDRRLILEDFTVTMNCGKWLEVDINTYIKIVGKTLTTGARVSGKLAAISTVNQGDKGGERFKVLWNQSDHLGEVNRLGQTASKLKRIFIAAYYGFEGYIDEYGYSVVENPTPEQTEYLKTVEGCPDPTIGAKQYLEMQRDLLKHDEDGLQEEIRQAPFSWKEVFETAGKKIYFNRVEHETRLEELKDDVKDLGRDPEKGENGRRGWFRENPDGTVRFVDDDKEGLWYVHKFPDNPNKFERSEILGVPKYKPRNTAWGAAGLDPFAHADATVEKGSDGCVIIRSRFSILDPDNSGMPAAMFLGRMGSKNKFHEQVFYGLKYFGVRMLGERAPSDWVDWAKENGYTDYLLSTKRSDRTEVFGAMPQNKEYLEEHLTEMIESSYNDVSKIPFVRLIKDRLGYDMKNRTDFDACIADGNALIALKEPLAKNKKSNKGVKFLSKGTVMTPQQY